MRALLGSLLLAGCTTVGSGGSGGGAGILACGTPTPHDGAVFAALTAVDWESGCSGGGSGLAPTCTTIGMSADGAFSWRAVSDYVERDQGGRWNFQARDDHSGIVCLDTGAVLAFSLDAGVLRFGGLGLTAGAPLVATGRRTDLSDVISDPLYPALSAHAWTKTNQFDLFRLAEDFTLARDGTFSASYRGGSCSHGGTWSLDLDPRTTGAVPVLLSSSEPNVCDLRGGTTAQLPASDVPQIDAGRLVLFDTSYRAPGAADTRSWFSFDGYGTTVATSGYLDRELSASAATTLDLDLANASTLAKTLGTLSIRVTPLAATADGFMQAGPTVELAQVDLGATVLAPGDHRAVSVSVAPPAAADNALFELELTYSDSQQPYTSRGDYIGAITP